MKHHHHKTLELNNKTLLIAGAIVVLVALLAWGLLAQRQRLHEAPLTPFTRLEILKEYKPDLWVPPCDPLSEKCEKVYEIEESVKGLEIDEKSRKSFR
ncbi:hypothetical protein ACFL10_00645 [Patescibacteria group bacterium]